MGDVFLFCVALHPMVSCILRCQFHDRRLLRGYWQGLEGSSGGLHLASVWEVDVDMPYSG
jgi:hypothetical protein